MRVALVKNIQTLWLTLFLALFLVAAGRARAGEELRFAVLYSLDGSERSMSESMEKGIRFALGELNRTGGVDGKRLEAVWVDYAGDLDRLREETLALVADPTILAIVGPIRSREVSIFSPEEYDQLEIPTILPFATMHDLLKGSRFRVRLAHSDQRQAEAAVAYSLAALDITRPALVWTKGSVSTSSFSNAVGKLFADSGITPSIDYAFPSDDAINDEAEQKKFFTACQEADVEMVYLNHVPSYLIEFFRGAGRFGLKAKFFGTENMDTWDVWMGSGNIINEACFISASQAEGENRVSLRITDFYNRTGEEIDGYSFLGYDAVSVLAESIKQGGADRLAIRDAMHQLQDLLLASGKVDIGEDGESSRDAYVLQITETEDGFFEPQAVGRYSTDKTLELLTPDLNSGWD
ncbi:MAG: ABC transporter substrate-binding protein [Planctomycetota bacterium]|jgi:branched-chain amino acid transport system substrate-binding protein|nr:ABC transporter substrate-binding protein [Planctomycetota bacterium]